MAILALIGVNLRFNIAANIGFKLSLTDFNWRGFVVWQVLGNLAGLLPPSP